MIAIVRDASTMRNQDSKLEFRTGDILKAESVAAATKGAEVVISAYGPGAGDAEQIVTAAESLVEGLAANLPNRLIVVNGAGSLEVSPGLQLLETPDFPSSRKKLAQAHRSALEFLKTSSSDWTCVSPSAQVEESTRAGHYHTGTNQLLVDQNGQSRISMEDFAVAVLDEVENPRFHRERFTVGY